MLATPELIREAAQAAELAARLPRWLAVPLFWQEADGREGEGALELLDAHETGRGSFTEVKLLRGAKVKMSVLTKAIKVPAESRRDG